MSTGSTAHHDLEVSRSDGAAPSRHGTTYLWTTAIGCLFVLLCVTGVAMMTAYSPSVSTAWASVFYLQDQLPAGWVVRGLHRFASDGLIIVCAGYLLHRILTRRYEPPRTRQWWFAIAFVGLAMGAALTGALLPWDQKAYWGTTVRVNIASLAPVVGRELRTLLLGGSEPGQLTLTRFFTLHVAIFPFVFYLALRLRRRNAATLCAPCGEENESVPCGSPDGQARRKAYRGMVRLAVVSVCLVAAAYTHYVLGSPYLHAPADASILDYPARPEWYNLFLFQWLKSFTTGDAEVFAAVVAPGLLTVFLASLPWWPCLLPRRVGHSLAATFVLALFMATGYLTLAAIWDDMPPTAQHVADLRKKQQQDGVLTSLESRDLQAYEFQIKRARAAFEANRAIELAREYGVPPEGPLALMRNDPELQGPRLFAAHCASCHRYHGHNGLGITPEAPPTSSDLAGYGTRGWIRALLENPMADTRFGLMKKPDGKPAHTRMRNWTNDQREDALSDADRAALESNFDAVAAYLADEALHPGQVAAGDGEDELLLRGRSYFMATCNECHTYRGDQEGTRRAPEMFGYASIEWIKGMISEPDHDTRYRSRGLQPAQMPGFGKKLTPAEISLIARWLHGPALKEGFSASEKPSPGSGQS